MEGNRKWNIAGWNPINVRDDSIDIDDDGSDASTVRGPQVQRTSQARTRLGESSLSTSFIGKTLRDEPASTWPIMTDYCLLRVVQAIAQVYESPIHDRHRNDRIALEFSTLGFVTGSHQDTVNHINNWTDGGKESAERIGQAVAHLYGKMDEATILEFNTRYAPRLLKIRDSISAKEGTVDGMPRDPVGR